MRNLQLRPAPATVDRPPADVIGDLRFRTLLGAIAWASLPHAVRARFSKRAIGGATILYAGTVESTWHSRLGHLLAHAARAIGGPLPIDCTPGAPASVSVTEDLATGGQIWSRLYGRAYGPPRIIHSNKRFAGPTGLEERIGGGFGISLTVHAEAGALVFRSAGYFWRLFGQRIALPRWAEPGAMAVGHHDLGNGRFAFTLDLTHPRFGPLVRQRVLFQETMR